MVPLIASVACRALVEACRDLGLDGDALAARAGLAPGTLADPEARVPATASDALWRAAYEASGDPALALRAASAVRFGAYRVLDYLGTTGPAVGDGLRRVASYFPLIDPRGHLQVEEARDRVSLTFASTTGAPLHRAAQEYTLTILLRRAREATVEAWDPLEVSFAFPSPEDHAEHLRLLGVRPRFDAPRAALVLSRRVWELPSRARDAGLFALLDAHARSLLQQGPASADRLSQVREAVALDLPGRRPSLAAAARRLGMSRRSLQRALEAEETSFARVVDEVREQRARTLLAASDVSLAEVSWLLGFSEQSAFTRAFKRWTGLSPSEHRASETRGTVRAPPRAPT